MALLILLELSFDDFFGFGEKFCDLLFEERFDQLRTSFIDFCILQANSFVYKSARLEQRNRYQLKLLFIHPQLKTVLLLSLIFNQRCCHCRSRLQKINPVFLTLSDIWHGFMLMTPHHQVNPLRKDAFHYRAAFIQPREQSLILILMDHQYVKPSPVNLFASVYRPVKFHLVALEGEIQTLIVHMPNPIQGDFCRPFSEQHRFHYKLFDVCDLAEVVYI
jgi:hypothetical protein